MRIAGDYNADGYATIRGLAPPDVAANLFKQIQIDLSNAGRSFVDFGKTHPLSMQQSSRHRFGPDWGE